MMKINGLKTWSLQNSPQGDGIQLILKASLDAVEPGAAVSRFMQCAGQELMIGERSYNLNDYDRVRIVAFGKAGAPMGSAAAEILGDYLTDGIIATKEGHLGQSQPPKQVRCLEAGHPVPDERSIAAARQIQTMLATSRPNDLVIALISGGGSALITAPATGIRLEDIQALMRTLLACGANIQEINCLRKHLDLIKGGGLAREAAPARLVALILSDVVGDPLDVIASGPTVPDPTTFIDALKILESYDILDQTPAPILDYLQRGKTSEISETLKPGDPIFNQVQNIIVGSNYQAAKAAIRQAQAEGFHTQLLTTYLQGEARQAGRMLACILKQVAASGEPLPRPACLVAGGETTVTLGAPAADVRPGLGGRNQELALSALNELAGIPDVVMVTLATDGGDGPTDAAGAVITGESLQRAHMLGLQPGEYLARHDAYHFFTTLDDLLKTGPTQTNVNDLCFLFAL